MSDPWAGEDWVTVQEVDAMPREVLEKAFGALQGIAEHPGKLDADTLTGLALLRIACGRALRTTPGS